MAEEPVSPLRIHVVSLHFLSKQLNKAPVDSEAEQLRRIDAVLKTAGSDPYGDADTAAGAVGVIEVCLDDLIKDTRERDSESYDGDSPTTLECMIQRRLDAMRARVVRSTPVEEKWPSAFMALGSLALAGAELSACIAESPHISFVEQFPDMWRLLGYPKIVLVVHRSRDVLSATGR